MSARPITFLSDYGTDDEFAGVCRAVIARIAPAAAVIDLTHGIPRHGVAHGAAVLANALPYTPAGVHLAVIDPGVGTPRRALAARAATDDRVLVGPDNGLLAPALASLGGAVEVVDVSLSSVRLEPISATFHGRDIFAPVAAHLSLGAALSGLGEPLDPAEIATLKRHEPVVEPGRVEATIAYVDRFGNAALDVGSDEVLGSGIELGHRIAVDTDDETHDAVYLVTFADVAEGALLLYRDSYGSLAVAVNRGSAAEVLGLATGDRVSLRPEP